MSAPYDFDPRICGTCEKPIGAAPSVELAGKQAMHHSCCFACPICSEPIQSTDELVDPSMEPYGLVDLEGKPSHLSCAQEAAWEAERIHNEDRHNYHRMIDSGLRRSS